jgi:hypothetical protein
LVSVSARKLSMSPEGYFCHPRSENAQNRLIASRSRILLRSREPPVALRNCSPSEADFNQRVARPLYKQLRIC